jgi:hypothetical protein
VIWRANSSTVGPVLLFVWGIPTRLLYCSGLAWAEAEADVIQVPRDWLALGLQGLYMWARRDPASLLASDRMSVLGSCIWLCSSTVQYLQGRLPKPTPTEASHRAVSGQITGQMVSGACTSRKFCPRSPHALLAGSNLGEMTRGEAPYRSTPLLP